MRFAGSAAMASGMAGSAAADALMPNNCFVAGTPVWVLRDGVDANAANAAMAEGADWRNFAEQKPIEEVEASDYALSRPEDDADGQLRFMPVTETYTNTTEEVVELRVVNYATGEHDHLTTTPGHPFWTCTGSASTASGNWEFAANLEPGDILTNADGRPLTVTATAHKARHEATYNFCVSGDHTYYVSGQSVWVHNVSEDIYTDPDNYRGKPGGTRAALRQAKDRAGVPRSQQATRQWTVGGDITKKGSLFKNYVYSSNIAEHGRYYEYDTPEGKRMVILHTNDPNPGRVVHAHAGKPKAGSTRYQQIGGKHHIIPGKRPKAPSGKSGCN